MSSADGHQNSGPAQPGPHRSIPQSDPSDLDARDPSLRQAVLHTVVTAAFGVGTLIVAAASSDALRTALLLIAPAIMLLGGLTALVRTYLAYRSGRRWGVWQGAAWFLLCLSLMVFMSSGSVVLNTE
ncbi:hypothetical protein [Gordonia asplenii]|uniref:hypothetical protein n=1 Tax=Gordonia asplenii TaxID=2725283 RepID=UPI0028A5D0AE|nr:hypothetical protein [Gordonia asplenii]